MEGVCAVIRKDMLQVPPMYIYITVMVRSGGGEERRGRSTIENPMSLYLLK